MPILYSSLSGDPPLNKVVFAGSHDAAITSGRSHIQTQNLNIFDQAEAGVRLFDIRITGASIAVPAGQPKQVELRAYHGESGTADKTRNLVKGLTVDQNVEVTRMKHGIDGVTGGFGMRLDRVLHESQMFVMKYNQEFLILKFDKSDNWELIAKECVRVLGLQLYTDAGNLNLKKLSEVAGKVIVLFPQRAIDELGSSRPRGIYGYRNLFNDGLPYDPNYVGLQYYGKGGTTLNPFLNKIKDNEKRQQGYMQGGDALQQPEIMGMMYWTATGLIESIRKRDSRLWSNTKVEKLKKLWSEGLNNYLQQAVPQGKVLAGIAQQSATQQSSTQQSSIGLALSVQQKLFLPNFVMIDFADDPKCSTIFALNSMTAKDITDLRT